MQGLHFACRSTCRRKFLSSGHVYGLQKLLPEVTHCEGNFLLMKPVGHGHYQPMLCWLRCWRQDMVALWREISVLRVERAQMVMAKEIV
ncbi:hypothetical protein BDA96_01G363700 [Sorghum bicolor]|uniref:Uncharacterized protein n=2 Tax=Sorghum bicolor TaxID=4558 RepID=A0A921UZR4_SORBI|nr:hypothetical protein BDA96_01G363700 [Sorghum bicolor]KXG39157.1 hypothetical protein SORBI_3001G340100 [Sorghum bicolor]